jgi:hypothetical protein
MRDNIKAALASDHVEIYGFYSREWATSDDAGGSSDPTLLVHPLTLSSVM